MNTAFVHNEASITDRIYVPCVIDKVGTLNSKNAEVNALWDTGATRTCISERLATNLGLMADGQETLRVADGCEIQSNVYSVQMTMGKFTIDFIRICELPYDANSYDVIIGMDIMTKGDMSIINFNGTTVLSFREPSLETINYVDEIELFNRCLKVHNVNVARNIKSDKCACGSGRAFSNCHGLSKYYKP